VWLAKFLQLCFAVIGVYLLWRIAANVADAVTARLAALWLATSAGYVVQAHLITTDLPVTFFMILAFWACQRLHGRDGARDYALAGLLVGLTGAMKYNGLVVGLALPVFHLFATGRNGVASSVLDRRLWLGMACVPLGFLAGNPFAAIEFRRFAGDLYHLFATSSEFIGASGESLRDSGIAEILATDHLGWPLFIVLMPALVYSIWVTIRDPKSQASATIVASGLVAGLYALYFAAKSNMQVRWLLPIVPFLLIATIPFWMALRRSLPKLYMPVTLTLLLYGAICSATVGLRFARDPRFEAVAWVRTHVPAGSSLESSIYSPRWNLHLDQALRVELMPGMSGRNRLYAQAYRGQDEVLDWIALREQADNVGWFTVEALHARRPDYIALSSIFFDRFQTGVVAGNYPEMRDYFNLLLAGQAGYEVVFDRQCCRWSSLLYPRDLLFVDNRLVILRRGT
jgi:hypothetical protein